MKNFKTFLFVLVIPFFIFWTPQKTDIRQDKNITSADLVGKWNQVNNIESLEELTPKVEFFQIINDSVVNIQIVDSAGRRRITGKWENGFNQKIGSKEIEINGHIKIACNLTDNHRYVLALKLSEDNGETVMLASKYKFEKEEK